MRKLGLFIILVLLISSAYAIYREVSSFSSGLDKENLSVLLGDTYSINITIPTYANVLNMTVRLSPLSKDTIDDVPLMRLEFENNMNDSSNIGIYDMAMYIPVINGNFSFNTSINSSIVTPNRHYVLNTKGTGMGFIPAGVAPGLDMRYPTGTNFSTMFWIKFENNTPATSRLISFSKFAAAEVNALFTNSTHARIQVAPVGTSTFGTLLTSQFTWRDWHHIAFIGNWSNADNHRQYYIYLDGELIQNSSGNLEDQGQAGIYFAATIVPNKVGGEFYMDDFRFYNRTGLSKHKIKAIMNESVGLFNPLVYLGDSTSAANFNQTGRLNESINISFDPGKIREIISQCSCADCVVFQNNCTLPLTLNASVSLMGLGSIELINLSYSFGLDNCTLFNTESLNISFKEESTGEAISVDYENTIDFWIHPSDKSSYSTSGDSVDFAQLCIFPNGSTYQTDMLIQYINGSTHFEYSVYNLSLTNVTQTLDLYVTGGTSQVVLTVQDLNGDPVPGAFVKVLKYDVGTGAYSVTEILETDGNGQTIGNIILIDAFYRFIIEYQGITRLIEPSSGGIRVLSTTKTFRINLEGADWVDLLDTTFGVATTLTFSDVTDSFVYTWNDPTSAMHQGCLSVVKRNRTGTTTIGDQCVTSAASSIVIPIVGIQNDSSFHATGYLLFDELMITNQLSKIFKALFHLSSVGNKQDTLMVGFILILALAFVGIPFPAVSFVLMGVGLFGTMALGIYDLGVGLIVAIIILFIIQIAKMRSG